MYYPMAMELRRVFGRNSPDSRWDRSLTTSRILTLLEREQHEHRGSPGEGNDVDRPGLIRHLRVLFCEYRNDSWDNDLNPLRYATSPKDMARIGVAIANNRYLKSLDVELFVSQLEADDDLKKQQLLRLFEKLGRNRSLVHFCLQASVLEYSGDILSEVMKRLESFFAENEKLKSLRLLNTLHLGRDNLRLIISALSKRRVRCRLEELHLTDCKIFPYGTKELMEFFKAKPEMFPRVLHLNSCQIGDEGCQFIAKVLGQKNTTNGTCELRNGNCGVDIKGMILNLDENGIGPRGIQCIAAALASQNCALKQLSVESNQIDENGIHAFIEAFSSNPQAVPRSLQFGKNDISLLGFEPLSRFLSTLESPINNLKLGWIDYQYILGRYSPMNFVSSFQAFLRPFQTYPHLTPRCLELRSSSVLYDWYLPISDLIEHRNSSLEDLRINVSALDEVSARCILPSLSTNTTLRRLIALNCNRVEWAWWSGLAPLLCDSTSIMSAYNSNHTIEYVGSSRRDENRQPSIIQTYLKMNKHADKAKVAQMKVIFNFFERNFSSSQFENFKPAGLVAELFRFVNEGFLELHDWMIRTIEEDDGLFDGENDDASDRPDEPERDIDDGLEPVENNSLTILFFLLKGNLHNCLNR